ncbi:MAG: hypothetical protein HQM14_07230 [SAR324 cluster bacterium]|nr:hypothetical protein [SAR324 cluster bacterium]
MQNLPLINNLTISSFKAATEEKEPARDQESVEEIRYSRQETHHGFEGANQRLDDL